MPARPGTRPPRRAPCCQSVTRVSALRGSGTASSHSCRAAAATIPDTCNPRWDSSSPSAGSTARSDQFIISTRSKPGRSRAMERSPMSSTTERVCAVDAVALLCTASAADGQRSTYGIGTSPAPGERGHLFAVLPDGRGLPPGSGSVEQGKVIYRPQCVACHGENLQGALADRLIRGRGTLANDDPAKPPMKTIESYWPYATTIFDYVKRAMPLASPGSLSDDQVYAVTAYILSEAKIVPPDSVLDAKSLAAVRMPNRGGFIADPRPEKLPPVARSPHQSLGLPVATK